jgi:hypothetical protein
MIEILPHDHYGLLLNPSGKTTDTELELKNFEKAEQMMAAVWSSVLIDSHEVVAEYINPVDREPPNEPDSKWVAGHIRQSQYFLQIIKCDETTWCRPCVLPGKIISHSVTCLDLPC